ncbi:TPA: transglycosylase SLT domain-containing protein [Candidatus Micrarchaeota archaeon]|nr:transglycosylase SLT domain-containing protein [Candidatus Micrarchaeota archaeon]
MSLLVVASLLCAAVELPSCAGRSARSASDCPSECYFFRPLNAQAGTCGAGVIAAYQETNLAGEIIPDITEAEEPPEAVPSARPQSPSQQPAPRAELPVSARVEAELAPVSASSAQPTLPGYEPMNARVKTRYDVEVERCARQYGIKADRLRAHICAETGFRSPTSVSSTGARGPVQIQPCTAIGMRAIDGLMLVQNPVCMNCRAGGTSCPACDGRRNCLKQGVLPGSEDERRILNPLLNICAAAAYIKQSLLRFGNSYDCVAMAYVGGPGLALRAARDTQGNCIAASEAGGGRYKTRVAEAYTRFRQGQCDACDRETHC